MNIKRYVYRFTMILIMVFALSSVTEYSYAYWATNLQGDIALNPDLTTTTGSWTFAPQWDANTTYSIGDRVTNNGIIYEAKKNSPNREPGVDSGWASQWIQIT